jgi:hypothetical protein
MTCKRLPLVFTLAAVVAASAFIQVGQSLGQTLPQRPQIDRNGVLILVRYALAALDQANKTGNYSVLRDIAAPNFAAANNPARLSEIFSNLRRQGVDLSGALVLEPQLTVLPEFDDQGYMRLAGFFPSVPLQLNFQMIFAPVGGQWRIFGLGATVGSSGPVAPTPPSANAAVNEKKDTSAQTPQGKKGSALRVAPPPLPAGSTQPTPPPKP